MGSQAEYRSISSVLVAHHHPLQLSIYDELPPVYHLIETKLSVSSVIEHKTISEQIIVAGSDLYRIS